MACRRMQLSLRSNQTDMVDTDSHTPIKPLSRASCHGSDELSAAATSPFQTICCCHTAMFLLWCKMLVLYEVAR
ncbi:hypothetical protein EYF80_001683 [Liparis tanakae]|uniref:Uncharacterized protein n=1 Tax=Liparis tanakae TaxID=230148 RepID=A0A4Z2JFR0_9TELE|nr:hypothetical protein EYF80_001683 [Liparis tanakae]